MRRCSLLLLVCALLELCTFGQVITEMTLPPGTPLFQPVAFTDDQTLVVMTAPPTAAVYRFSGLPDAPNLVITVPTGVEPASAWYRLDERTAAYDAVTGFVVLVRDLPGVPVFVPTTLPAGARLVGVNATTAVHVRPQGFDIVRHGNGGATVTFVPSAEVPRIGPALQFGGIQGKSLVGLSAGPDGTPGTLDDRILRLNGLDGPPSGAAVISLPRTATFAPEGFVVTPTGVGVAWHSPALSQFGLEVVKLFGAPTSVMLSVTTPIVFGHAFGSPWDYGVRVVPQNGVLLSYDDFLGTGHVLLRQLDGTPSIGVTWFSSSQFNTRDEFLDDRSLVSYDFITYRGFYYTRWSINGTTTVGSSQEPCWSDMAIIAPNSQVLAAFGNGSSCAGSGSGNAVLVLERLTPNGPVTQTFQRLGSWARTAGPISDSRILAFALGSSRVAGFVTSTPYASTSNLLRICSFPLAAPREAPGRRLGPAPIVMSLSSAVPSTSQPLTLSGNTTSAVDPVGYLAISLGRTTPFDVAPFDAIVHADPALLLPVVTLAMTPTPAGGSQTSLTIPGGLPPALAGLPLHCQMAVSAAGNLILSDLAIITYGL